MRARFDGPYGRLYDAIASNERLLQSVWPGSALGAIPELVRRAYRDAPDEPLLDVPCGAASSLVHGAGVARTAPVVALDVSVAMLSRAADRVVQCAPPFEVDVVEGDALNLPMAAATFGAVLSINGLHCMPDPARFVAELARVARTGATLTMTTLVDAGSLRSRIFNDVFRRGGVLPATPPTLEALVAMLQDAGWSLVEPVVGGGLVAVRCVRVQGQVG